MSERPMACAGERVIEDGDFLECENCGTRVRHDLADHGFFGFVAGCSHHKKLDKVGKRPSALNPKAAWPFPEPKS